MSIDRNRLRTLSDKATEGPWYTFTTKLGRINGIGSKAILEDEAVMEDEWSDAADAEFIAASRTAVPELLDELEQAEVLIAQLRNILRSDEKVMQEQADRIRRVEKLLDWAEYSYDGKDAMYQSPRGENTTITVGAVRTVLR